MQIFTQIAPLKAFLSDIRRREKSVGLVPTMGALHAGHISLFKACNDQNDVTVGSIFVNPIQFNNPDDLTKYPRTLEKDIELLESIGCDALFAPESSEMYPEKSVLTIDFGTLDKVMEGRFRPGHFSGVALVVSKLFNIVQPDRAYFGQKDWQQFAIIQKLIEELNFNIGLHSVKTLREADGLALSSRNLRLNTEERKTATIFYQCLLEANRALALGKPLQDVKEIVSSMVDSTPGVKLEYFELADSQNLNLLENVEQSGRPIMCIAGYVGEIRLIDNMFVN
ncbi:MAG TPA: pantoate--beta-alanine ligase [Chryseosolibacter sp.]|nr:pantoate--beta-alanine ligase [Chryseosolibacter sp.]